MKAEGQINPIINLKDLKNRKEKEKAIFSYFNPELEKLKYPPEDHPQVATCCGCLSKKNAPPKQIPGLQFTQSLDPDFKLQSVVIIYNPFSGNGRGGKNFPIIEQTLKDHKIKIEKIFKTEKFRHAVEITEHAEEIDKVDAVICTGGDGTLNEVINGLMKRAIRQGQKYPKKIGYVAGGTANDMAEVLYGREKRYDPKYVMEKIIKGKPFGVDLMKTTCNNKKTKQNEVVYSHLCCLWGIGVSANVTADGLRCLGPLRYDVGAVMHILKGGQHKATLQVDDKPKVSLISNIIFVLNQQYLGSELLTTPMAVIDDGYLDLIIFEDTTRYQTIKAFDELKRDGSHIYLDKCLYGQFKKMTFDTEKETMIQFDGEDDRIFTTPYTIEVEPKLAHFLY